MSGDLNGAYHFRFDRIEKDIEESRHEIVSSIDKNTTATTALAVAVKALAEKLDVLASTHVKIIYWLLVLVSTAFLGTKGIELYKIFLGH